MTNQTQNQLYSIATMLSIDTLDSVLKRLQGLRKTGIFAEEEIAHKIKWAVQMDKYYKKRDGYVPKKVIAIINH